MPKFRKRPVVVEAVQFNATGQSFREILDMGFTKWRPGQRDTFTMETLEGERIASKGDWIIKGVDGEFYPCKPDIFDKTYEPVSG